MSLRSTLLRMVIGLGVILNGSPFAMAASSIRMNDHSDTRIFQTAQGTTSAMPSCHETAATGVTSPDPAKSVALTKSTHRTAVCCKAGHCKCACVHAAATLSYFQWIVAAENHASIVRHVEATLPVPILPQLSRPPIT